MMYVRKIIEQRELQILAPYAVKSGESAGRIYPQQEDAFRTCFQRDRDRIIHSKAFRRLQEKTQVFLAGTGDHYRNRLIHSVECSQISRGIARVFGLNEDLAEAIALAHDLGHTPFGHAGEAAMDEVMKGFGLHFEHNEQSLRVVEKLEKSYKNFDGINLTKEVLDGMMKHRTPYDHPKIKFVTSAHLEGQIVDLADEIAYTSSDIDDGLRSEMFTFKELMGIPLIAELCHRHGTYRTHETHGTHEAKRSAPHKISTLSIKAQKISSLLLNAMVKDLHEESEKNLKKYKIQNLNQIRNFEGKIINFSKNFQKKLKDVRKFLVERFYFSLIVDKQNKHGQEVIKKLFDKFYKNPKILPENFQKILDKGEKKEIVIKDYIAGMTDNFAEKSLSNYLT